MIDVMEPELNRHLNEIDGQLHELECMAEFAVSCAELLKGSETKPGFMEIELSTGDRLAFCCIDIQRRIGLVRDAIMCGRASHDG